jgi:hypothetical protein
MVDTPTVVDDFKNLGGCTLAKLAFDLVLFVGEARITRFLIGYHMPLHGFNPDFQGFQY